MSDLSALQCVIAEAAKTLRELRIRYSCHVPEPSRRRDWACKKCGEDRLNRAGFQCSWHRAADIADQLDALLVRPAREQETASDDMTWTEATERTGHTTLRWLVLDYQKLQGLLTKANRRASRVQPDEHAQETEHRNPLPVGDSQNRS